MRSRWLALLGGCVGLAALIRRISSRSGVSLAETGISRPGDDIVPEPTTVWNRGVTIHARASAIWPWLAQMGYGRAGFYAPWWVDELVWRVPSPNRESLLSDAARVAVGDVLADGPEYLAYWRVKLVDPGHALVLWTRRHPWRGAPVDPADADALAKRERDLLDGGLYIECSWGFYLDEREPGDTRLLIRTRGVSSPWWLRRLPYGLVDAYVSHAELGTIKRLVEAARHSPAETEAPAVTSGGAARRAQSAQVGEMA